MITINNECSEQVCIPLSSEKHQPPVKVLVDVRNFLSSLYAKRQRHVQFRLSKELCMRLREGENDFIFIHLPWALSSDTGNRALSIWYWLVLIHYPSLRLHTHLHQLSSKAPLQMNSIRIWRFTQRLESPWFASLPLLALPSYALPWFAFSSPAPKKHDQPSTAKWKGPPGNGFQNTKLHQVQGLLWVPSSARDFSRLVWTSSGALDSSLIILTSAALRLSGEALNWNEKELT